ncbi:MAG: TlpA family protein disulfide reductase [Pseudorhodobacter sp.]|nr:TlpA family protein disulfide reductase [Pseudorhodobacter sp.]
MRRLVFNRLLYTGLLLAANGAFAGVVDPGLLVGDMGKLVIEEPRALPAEGLVDRADAAVSLETYRGKWVVVNFWATWCVPCRTEMPALDRLQTAMPGLTVVTVAVGPNPLPAIDKFLTGAGVQNVVVWRDPQARFAAQVGVMGLPVTVVVNPEGQEVARLLGGAEWDQAGAQAVLTALMAP